MHTNPSDRSQREAWRRAFTLVELLVVIAIIGILIGVLIPTLGSARRSAQSIASVSQLKQLGAGIAMYLPEHENCLPQMRVDGAGNPVEGSDGDNIGALFGGKLGQLPFYGIDRVGPERRPLNQYVWDEIVPADETDPAKAYEIPVFQDPTDNGTTDAFLASMGLDTSSTYDLLGTSYTLNDHALDTDPGDEAYPTLIPKEGGRMPRVLTPTKTWLLGTQPIYNYDDGSDRRMRWGSREGIVANLLFVDLHAEGGLPVPEGQVQTTGAYTHLPSPRWMERFGVPTP